MSKAITEGLSPKSVQKEVGGNRKVLAYSNQNSGETMFLVENVVDLTRAMILGSFFPLEP